MKIENCLESEVKLECGLKINGKEFKNIIVREVVGYDEEAISQPKFKKNASGLIIELISRCIAEIPGAERFPSQQELKDLPIGILDTLTLAIRKVTVGDDIEIKAFCPGFLEDAQGNRKPCKKPYEALISINDIEIKKGAYVPIEVILSRGIVYEGKVLKKATLRLVDGNVQETFLKTTDFTKFGELSTEFIFKCVIDIDGVIPTEDMVRSMSSKDRRKITEALKNAPGPRTVHECICETCGEVWETPINILDFLA